MCGPSGGMKGLAARQTSLANTMMANYNANYASQSAILSRLTNLFTPIAQAGPDQAGFGPQELAALNTQAGEGVGINYAKATQAVNTQLAARGGGNEFLPTGARASIKAGMASLAANQLSNEQLAITRANYAQGRQNWQQATSGLNALAGEYNPNPIGGMAESGYQSAFGMEQKIQEMKNQKWGAIAGAITGVAKAGIGALTGGASLAIPGMSPLGGVTQGGGTSPTSWSWGGIPMPGSSSDWGG